MATIQVVDTNGNDLGQQEAQILSTRFGPYQVDYEGQTYRGTGKSGENIKTEKQMVEMATAEDQRLWISLDETLITLD